MDSLFLDFAISTILTALRLSFKNAERKAKLKAVMLKIQAMIQAVWPDDPDFDLRSESFKTKVAKESRQLKASA